MATRDTPGLLEGRSATQGALTYAWARVRFTAGMTILSAVCVVSHGLVLVHELTNGTTTRIEGP